MRSPCRCARRLSEILERAQTDGATRAIVLTGSEGVFCSGGDISGMDVKTALDGRERMATHKLIRLMAMGSLPIVAAVEGWCVGGGLSIACAADNTIVAAEDARFMAGFHKIGLMSDLGLPHTLPARVRERVRSAEEPPTRAGAAPVRRPRARPDGGRGFSAEGRRALAIASGVSDAGAVQEMVCSAEAALGPMDPLVNNAWVAISGTWTS